MSWKNTNQSELSDLLIVSHKALEELDVIHALIDWRAIEAHFQTIHNKKQGQEAYRPLLMFKALLLPSWYSLSDPQLEKQLVRDLLFRRFVGLNLSSSVPDHSSLWRFRQLLIAQNLLEVLLNSVAQQLQAQDLIMRCGEISIIDATVIEAHQSRPRKNAQGENTQDPEAGYNVKVAADGKKTCTDGYKAHVNVDEDGFIKTVAYSAGNVHDSQVFAQRLTGNEHACYADKAYKSQKHDQRLASPHCDNAILHKAKRRLPLTVQQKQQNKRWSSIRSTVERTLGILKLHYGIAKARYLGLARHHARFMLTAIAYNLKRAASIHREMLALA